MKTGRVLLKIYVFRWIFFTLLAVNLTEGGVTPRIYSFVKSRVLSSSSKPFPGPEKNYTSIRVDCDSSLLLKYHEQTVAVVEVDQNGKLLGCELLEVRTDEDQRVTIESLKPLMREVTKISFDNMIDLMSSCHLLNSPFGSGNQFMNNKYYPRIDPKEFTSIFSGVFPGTKWCGNGDLASTYYDLGPHWQIDQCCRTHDFCPVKIPGQSTRYGLTNSATYTSSHCTCDKFFFACLKFINTPTSKFIGNIFFNFNPSNCIEDVVDEYEPSKSKKKFMKLSMRF